MAAAEAGEADLGGLRVRGEMYRMLRKRKVRVFEESDEVVRGEEREEGKRELAN